MLRNFRNGLTALEFKRCTLAEDLSSLHAVGSKAQREKSCALPETDGEAMTRPPLAALNISVSLTSNPLAKPRQSQEAAFRISLTHLVGEDQPSKFLLRDVQRRFPSEGFFKRTPLAFRRTTQRALHGHGTKAPFKGGAAHSEKGLIEFPQISN